MTSSLTHGTRLGAALRARRAAQKLTLAKLAERTELSQSFLSQLENGLTNSSLRSLQRIAEALDTTATAILAAADTDAEPVARAGDETLDVSGDSGGRVRSLVRGDRQLKALEFSGETHDDREFVHDNDEILYVVRGSAAVTMRTGRDEWTEELDEGDALYIDAQVKHRWKALTPDTRVVVFGVADGAAIRRSSRRVPQSN